MRQQMRTGQVADAIGQLQQLLLTSPENDEAIFLLAQCEVSQARYAKAIELLDQIDSSQSSFFSDSSWLAANLLTKLHRLDEAVLRLEALSAKQPSLKLHRVLAMMLNQLGRRREAGLHLSALAEAGDISEEELFQMGSYNQPIIAHGGLKLNDSGPLTSDALNEAKRERIEGDLGRARRIAERLADQYPESAAMVAFFGQILADSEDYERLSQWAEQLPKGIEKEPEYWYALAKWCDSKGQREQAVRCYLENVSIDPTDRNAYRALAHLLQSLGRKTAASDVTQRYTVLQEVHLRLSKLGQEPGTTKGIEGLAKRLELLQRPFEAIAWRKVALLAHGSDPALVVELERRRASLAQEHLPPDLQFVTCGLRTSEWPLPDFKARESQSVLAEAQSSSQPKIQIRLIDVSPTRGLNYQYDNGDQQGDSSWYIYQLSGGGIGVIDFDLDGWQDLYFSQAGEKPWSRQNPLPNQLFRNLNGRKFEQVAEVSASDDRGYGQGISVADINQDGFHDLLVANIGINVILINQGDGTFQSSPLPSSTRGGAWTTSIVCGDLSGDHLPEIVEVNYIDDATAFSNRCEPNNQNCNPSIYRSALSHVWSTNAAFQFVPWEGCQGMEQYRGFGFAALITNLDCGPGNDLFLVNDTVENFLWCKDSYAKDSGNQLQECAKLAGCAVGWLGQRQGSMGVAIGDFDRDGRPDLHVTNYWNQPADLFLQKSDALFTNATMGYGLYETTRSTVGWGTQAVDLDRDGWLDLAVLNGHVLDRRQVGIPLEMKPQLFRGEKGHFNWISDESTIGDYWTKPSQGRTLATVDYNRDGKPDLVGSHLDVPVALLENQTESQRFIRIHLVGVQSERDAIGAKITVSAGGQFWTAWKAAGGFACSNEPVIDIGVGDHQKIDKLEVLWPSGIQQSLGSLKSNEAYFLVENEPSAFPLLMQP